MITRSVVSAIRIVPLLLAIAFFPSAAQAARAAKANESAPKSAPESFAGYTADIRDLARRVVEYSTPGNHDKLKAETRALGKRMHAHAILSINAIPEKVFLKARNEGWSKESVESMRVISEVAPLSVPLWAWLFKEDVVHFRLGDAIRDFGGIAGAVRRFGPALLGYGAWLVTYLVALSCWFSTWAAVCLFLRGRPSLEADLKRILKVPFSDYLAPVVAAAIFVVPVLCGVGLAVAACIWLAVSTVYLRRAEIVIMTVAVVMMACLVLGGGILHSFDQIGGNTRKGGWLGGDGNIPDVMPAEGAPVFSADAAWMLDFARARIDMQAGRPTAAEARFTELLQTGKAGAEVLNNRGIARAQQGKLAEALADFEAARNRRPGDAPSLWNAYQVHLQTFNLDRAAAIQAEAWAGVQKLQPYGFRPAEIDQGEWIASGMPVGEIWLALIRSGNETIRDAGKNNVFRMFFHPMSPYGALFFLAMAYVWSMVWKAASQKLWVNCTCRVCGTRSMIIASRETSDICTPCRAQIGGGIRAGEERDRRVQGIVLHRRFVRLAAIFVPGSGVLWAGKDVRSFAFGLLFAGSLAGVTTSLGIAAEGNPIVYSLQKSVLVFFLSSSVLLWIVGAAWGLRSFASLQRRFNIIGGR